MTTPNDQPLTEEDKAAANTLAERLYESIIEDISGSDDIAAMAAILLPMLSELRHLRGIVGKLVKVCKSSQAALRSYQYGNSSTELAEEIADDLGGILELAEHSAAHPTDSGGGLNLDAKENKS